MRIAAILLLLASGVLAQPALTPKDQETIRKVIDENLRKLYQAGSGEIWSERGPWVVTVASSELLAPDVAIADADAVRTGTFLERIRYTFILKRTVGQWKIVRRILAGTLTGIDSIRLPVRLVDEP
jgi:hypothetical protein